jgi:hypothetical protein
MVGVVCFMSNFLEQVVCNGVLFLAPADASGCFLLVAAKGRQDSTASGRDVPCLPESWCAVALFPFSSPLSSLILYVYLTFYVYYKPQIQRLQHISKNILARRQFLGPRRLFDRASGINSFG